VGSMAIQVALLTRFQKEANIGLTITICSGGLP